MSGRSGKEIRPYYEDERESLRDLFGARTVRIKAKPDHRGRKEYPVLTATSGSNSTGVRTRLSGAAADVEEDAGRRLRQGHPVHFREEWQSFSEILPEHEKEFQQYFNLVDLGSLRTHGM